MFKKSIDRLKYKCDMSEKRMSKITNRAETVIDIQHYKMLNMKEKMEATGNCIYPYIYLTEVPEGKNRKR